MGFTVQIGDVTFHNNKCRFFISTIRDIEDLKTLLFNPTEDFFNIQKNVPDTRNGLHYFFCVD